MMKNPLSALILIILFVGVACQLPFTFRNQTENTSAQFSPEAAQVVEKLLEEIESQKGTFAFTITEEELTSYITLKLAETQDDLSITNIHTTLDNDQIIMTGDFFVSALGINIPIELIITAETDVQENLVFNLESINLGNLAVSDTLEQQLSKAVNEALTNNISNQLTGTTIDTIYIDNHMLTISGTIN